MNNWNLRKFSILLQNVYLKDVLWFGSLGDQVVVTNQMAWAQHMSNIEQHHGVF